MIGSSLQKLWPQAEKPTTKRLLIVTSFIISCMIAIVFLIMNQNIEVSVSLNGEKQQVTTQAKTVQELLQELSVEYTHNDEIHPALHTELVPGMDITWNQSMNVVLSQLGEIQSVWTTTKTVGEFIQEQGITLEEHFQVQPDLSARITEHQFIEVAKVYEKTVKEEFTVPFQIVRRDDPSLLKGQEKVAVEGKEGKGINQYVVTYKNGFELKREKMSTEVVEEKRDQIVAVGTIASVSRGGYLFAPRKIMDNVTLTAYSAGPSHTGKTPDHPQYGMTRSGTRATEGRTIAVDPNVIPLGTWVYIEGIGLRRAEDTGGAVKGTKIDVYYEDDSTATSFGTKRGYKVYVIGKNKPETSE